MRSACVTNGGRDERRHALDSSFIAAAAVVFSALQPSASPPGDWNPCRQSDHRLELWAGQRRIRSYTVAIGMGGLGPKQFEGDMTTPVGTYDPRSSARSLPPLLNVSYPNHEDRRRFDELKRSGAVPKGRGIDSTASTAWATEPGRAQGVDWTAGCIAVDDAEIDKIARLVTNGTRLVIQD